MKKFFLFLLMLTVVQTGFSQPLALNDFIKLRNEQINNVETFLLAKNWEFASSKKEDDTTAAIVAFRITINKADEIIQYLYSESDSFHRLWYTTFNKQYYIQLSNQAKSLNFKFQKSQVDGETLSNLFYKNGIYIIFRSSHFETDKSQSIIMYKIELYQADDYLKILPL